jgi:alpha(1,3/1,4) fucosyltransferase
MTVPADISVFVDPSSHHFLGDELFNPANRHNIDGAHTPYFYLRDLFQSAGIEVHTGDYLVSGEKRNKQNIYFSLGYLEHYQRLINRPDVILSGLFTFEAPIVQPSLYRALPRLSRYFKRIYSFSTNTALARFGCGNVALRKFHIPYPYDGVIEDLWRNTDRKFLTLLNCNRLCRRTWQELYTERLRALDFFSHYDEIDLYGLGWDKPPYRVGETWIPIPLTRINRYLHEYVPFLPMHPFEKAIQRTYRGVAVSKYVTQSRYTFTICYENMRLDGWLNENLFDCFLVGTIPVFLGPPDITDYVPANCFIDKRQFPTYEELRSHLKSLGPNEIQAYKENARDYISSASFKPFTKESFAQYFTRAVEEDLGVDLRVSSSPGANSGSL